MACIALKNFWTAKISLSFLEKNTKKFVIPKCGKTITRLSHHVMHLANAALIFVRFVRIDCSLQDQKHYWNVKMEY
jgi:hypothetical protein